MPPPEHWSVNDWLTALGVLAAWTTIFGTAVGLTVRFVVRAVFRDKLAPLVQEVGTLSAAVGRLDSTLQEHIKYARDSVHDLRDFAQKKEMAVANLQGDYREIATTMRHLEKTLDKIEKIVERIATGRAGG